MAAVLLRRGPGLCVRCIHRELCRVVWRPQAALFSSKPSDRKPPRRTHIKKAKPQPALDVAKLLEQLFSQKRPDTAPPAGKARPAQASSISTKPHASSSSSSVKVPTSSIPPAASSLLKKNIAPVSAQPETASLTKPKTSFSSETPQQSSQVFTADAVSNATTTTSTSPPTSTTPAPVAPPKCQTSAETVESKAATEPALSSSTYTIKTNVETSSSPAAAVEPLIETAIEPSIEASPPVIEAVETSAAVVGGPVEPVVDAAAEEVHSKSFDSGVAATVDPLIETTIEPSVEASISALETAEAQVDALAGEVRTKSIDIGEVNLLHIAKEEPLIETAVRASVESNTSAAAVPESTIKPTINAQALQTSSTDSVPVNLSTKEEPLIETTVEASVETSRSPLESRAAVADTVEITVAQTSNSIDSRVIDFTQTAKVEPIIETTVGSAVEASPPLVEALETRAAVVGGPVEPIVDAAAEEVHTKSIDSGGIDFTQTAKVEPLIETTIEPSVETSTSDLEIPESRAAVAGRTGESTVDAPANEVRTNSTDSGVIDFTQTAKVEPLIETTVESSVEAMRSTLDGRAAVSESIVEEVDTKSSHSEVIDFTQTAKLEPLIEATIESRAAVAEGPVEPKVETGVDESLSHAALIQTVQESAALPLINEVESSSGNVVEVAEEMNLEAVTLNLAKGLVKSLKTDELLLAKSDLDEKAEKRLQELLLQTGVVAEFKAAAETENSTETLTEVLSKWESLSEDLHELEGETGTLVKELLCHVPAVLSETSTSVEKSSKVEEGAMTLESITLADIKTEVRSLECEALQETRDALENKADVLAKEEKMEVKMEKEDVADLEGTIEAEMLALDSISEAADVLEAETSVFLESMFGSEQGLTQPLGASLIEKKEGEVIVQEAEKESKEKDGSVLEAMSLESVTLAEIEASLGTLESESLNDTSAYLEEEADILAKEEKMEVKMEKEDVADLEGTIEAEMLALDSISEAADALEAETSVFLESMFGSEQGLTQPLGALLIEKKEGEVIVQEAEKESKEKDGRVLEAMSLESVTLAEIEASLGTLESESLNETSAYLEEEAEILAGEKKVEVEDGVAFEEMTEALTVESLSLPEADDLSEALQTDELMEELLFSIPGHAEESRTGGQEVVRQNNLDETAATGSEVADTVAVEEADDLPAPPAQKEVLLGQEEEEKEKEEEEVGAKTEDLEVQEGAGTHADLDPVQRLFLEKIREYDNMSRLSGEPVEMDPDYEKSLSEETAKLQRLYGGGDLSSFPEFTFTEPTLDQDSK